jgi:pimeloyl-ACP methyl ester carboxylesterase
MFRAILCSVYAQAGKISEAERVAITQRTGAQPGSVAEDLAALVDYLALPPFHLLGVAGGGFVARVLLCDLRSVTHSC